MKKLIVFLLPVCLVIQSNAQDKFAQKYARLISAKHAKKHLSIIASDAFEGRETGKPGADKAAQYLAKEFKKLNLQAPVNGSYFLQIPLVEPSFEVKSMMINGKAFSNLKDFYATGNTDLKTIDTREIIFVGYGISDEKYDDLKGIDITGKTVLVINKDEPAKDGISWITRTVNPSDWSNTQGRLNKSIQLLQSKRPALILAISPDVQAYLEKAAAPAATGRLLIKREPPRPPSLVPSVFNITPQLANELLIASGKTYETLKMDIDTKGLPQSQAIQTNFNTTFGISYKDVKAADVLGYMPGTDLKDELLVISAHYDHIGLEATGTDKVNNGADDDGSGTTGILEIARAFAKARKQGKGPRRSILFLGNAGEEKGLLGSEYYTDHPVFPLKNTIANLNIDMIGRVDPAHHNDPDYCYLIGSDKLSTTLHKISENANAIYTRLKIDYKYNDPKDPERIYYRSDHYNFAKHNVPVIFYFNGVHEDYHQPGDEISKINFPLLVKRTQLVFYTGWELANRDERPVVDITNDMPQSR